MNGSEDGDDNDEESSMLFEEEQNSIEWPIPRLFWDYGQEHMLLIGIALFGTVLSPLASLVPPYILQTIIDAVLLENEPVALPGVPTVWVPMNRLDQLYFLAGTIMGAAAIAAALNWLSGWAWGRFAQEVQHVIRTDSYEKIQHLGLGFFDNQQTGQIMSILNNDVNQLNRLLERFLGDFLRIIVQFVGIAAVLVYLHWQLAIVALVVVPVLAVISRYFVKQIKPGYKEVRQQVGALNARIENNLSGIQVIKAFTAESYEANRVTESSQIVYDKRWDVITTRIKYFPTMNIVNWLSFGVLIIAGGIWIVDGPPLFFTMPLSVGTLVAFLIYNQQFTTPLMQAGHLVDLYYDARASVVRIFALQRYEIDVETEPGALSLDRVDGRITFENVTFSYDSDEEPVLVDINFEVDPGSFVGIVGSTGSGKTTLMKLLIRFYDPNEGTIRLDGYDLRDLDLQSLRGAIGMVSQEPYLFSGTVRENVAYGRSDVTDKEIEQAVRMASAHNFVKGLEDGYDTQVGQRGVKLSGGQRQRLAIARAIIRDPELLILDEATSHVDNETEVLIQHSLEDLIEHRTTFVIAHRLSTIRHADVILVLDDGRIVERGTHKELLAENGQYANLWQVQVGEFQDLPETFFSPN